MITILIWITVIGWIIFMLILFYSLCVVAARSDLRLQQMDRRKN